MRCSVCKENFSPLRNSPKHELDICGDCAKQTSDSFIFFCRNCDTYDIVDKDMAIMFAPDHDVKRQLLLLKNDNVIIEQDSCMTCAGAHCC